METVGIGELARRTGLRPSAIRYYESVGLLAPPRNGGGWRRYDEGAVEHLKAIKMARDLGFSIEDIQTLLNGFSPDTPPPERWRKLAAEKLPQLDLLIRQASAMKRLLEHGLNCGCVRVEDCFINDCAGIGAGKVTALKLVPLTLQPASVLRARAADPNGQNGVAARSGGLARNGGPAANGDLARRNGSATAGHGQVALRNGAPTANGDLARRNGGAAAGHGQVARRNGGPAAGH